MVYKLLSCLFGKFYIPQRWLGIFLTQCVLSVCFCMRVSTSVAISRMVKKSTINKTSSSKGSSCPVIKEHALQQYGENDWNEFVQSWILNSFFIGYVIMHIPAGYMADKHGSRWVITSGVLVSVICTALIPISADKLGYTAVILLRMAQGFGQGVIFPGISSWQSRWVPLHERSFLCALSYTGNSLGPLLGTLVTGTILKNTTDWRRIYYFWSCIGCILFFTMQLYFYSDPITHLHITPKENVLLGKQLVKQQAKTWPIGKILSDLAVIGIIIGHAGHSLTIFFIGTNMPRYIRDVLKYDIADNVEVTSLPYLSMLVSTILSGRLADWGIMKKGWDIGFVRKFYATIASVATFAIVGVGYVNCNSTAAVALFTVALCFKGFFFSSLKLNAADISTQYAGTIMAFANGAGSITGFIGPYIVSAIESDNSLSNWRSVFWVLFGTSVVTNFLYVIMGSGQRRRWDYPEEDRQFFQGPERKWRIRIFDGVDEDKLAVERGRADLLIGKDVLQ